MRKLISVLLLLLFAIGGCTKKADKVEKKDSLYILYATPLSEHPIWLQSKDGFEQACKEIEANCDWIGPNVIDTIAMEDVIVQGIYEKADGIITQGVIDKEIAEKAKKAGIPLTFVDSNIKDVDKFSFYGKNFNYQAELMLEEIEKTLGKNKKLIIGIQAADLNFEIAQEQIKEIRNVFKKHPGGFEIVSISESKSDKVHAKSEWENELNKNPDINVTINFAAESADACGEIVDKLNRKKDIFIFGVDDMDTTISYIKKGIIDASIVTSFFEYGYLPVYQFKEYKETGNLPEQVNHNVSLIVVNKKNVDTYKEEFK